MDGELVVLDDDGRSSFAKLMFGRAGSHYFAFDLLLLEETDLRAQALEWRKAILQTLLGSPDPVRYRDHITGSCKAFFELVRQAGLEGGWSRRAVSHDIKGRLTDDWLKVRCLRTLDFVVGGWIPDGSRFGHIRALLRGEFFDVTRPSKPRFPSRVRGSVSLSSASRSSWSILTSIRHPAALS
jgi:bifunctional non-homologous end joining protein LigD